MKWLILVPMIFFFGFLLVVSLIGAVLWGTGLLIGAAFHYLPWILLALGVWMVFRPAGRRHHRPVWAGPSGPWGVAPPPRPPPASRPSQAGSSQAASSAGGVTAVAEPPKPEPKKRELPIDLKVKVEQIRHKADVLLGYAQRFPPFSHDLHLVRQTAADYLPRTVAAYLALPGVEDPVVGPDEKTALQELREQLELLDRKLDEIAGDLQREDVDQLLANRRFLEERFKAREGPSEEGT